jgi:hypothetical protein
LGLERGTKFKNHKSQVVDDRMLDTEF